MERREFGKIIAAGAVSAALAGCNTGENHNKPIATLSQNQRPKKKKALMHIGCQRVEITKESLEFRARCGVFNIDGRPPKTIPGKGWDLDDSLQRKEMCEKYGISLDAYHLPLESGGIDVAKYPNIMLGKSPERDREIEIIQQMIEVAGKTKIRTLLYNTTILGVLRTEDTPGRGGSSSLSWDYEKALRKNEGLTVAGEVSLDEMYERITYLLDRILPVAEEWKVQLGNHIADPPLPAAYRGIWRWDSPNVFEGIKRFARLYDSPYHGFNFCIGVCAEGLKDPNNGIHEIIRFVGERKQLFNVHLRNIKGGFNKFQEVYPDEGDMDFYKVLQTLWDVEYPYMLMPDHTPKHPDDPEKRQAFAFAYGYIKGLIQAVNSDF
jgi:mannonate dehydratase